MEWDLHPWQGAEGEEQVLHLGKPPHQQGDQLGHKAASAQRKPSNPPVAGRTE